MKIKLSVTEKTGAISPTITIAGLILTIYGVSYDLSVIPEGGRAEGELPFIGICTRDEVTILYQYDGALAESIQSPNIADYTFDVIDGEVPCPIVWRKPEEVTPDGV